MPGLISHPVCNIPENRLFGACHRSEPKHTSVRSQKEKKKTRARTHATKDSAAVSVAHLGVVRIMSLEVLLTSCDKVVSPSGGGRFSSAATMLMLIALYVRRLRKITKS